MALTQGLIDSYWRKYNQRRALTGLPSSYQEQRGTLDPMMEGVANKDIAEARLRYENSLRQQQLDIQKDAIGKQDRAAMISGIANTGGLVASMGLGYKALQNQSANTDLMKQYLLGKPQGVPQTTGVPLSSGANLGAGSAGILTPGGIGSGVPMASAAPYSSPVSTLSYGAGGEVGAGVAPAAGSAGGGYASMLPGLGAAAGLYGLQRMSSPYVDKAIGGSMPYTAKGWELAGLPGAATGATIDIGIKVYKEAEDFFSKIF